MREISENQSFVYILFLIIKKKSLRRNMWLKYEYFMTFSAVDMFYIFYHDTFPLYMTLFFIFKHPSIVVYLKNSVTDGIFVIFTFHIK